MDTNQHRFPMFVDLQGVHALVVGGGPVALRKTHRLIDAGARVNVVAPNQHEGFKQLMRENAITVDAREFVESDIQGMAIIIAATGSLEVNRNVARLAKAAGAYVNVANDPAAGSFIMPSLIDRTPLLIAISSGGASVSRSNKTARYRLARAPTLLGTPARRQGRRNGFARTQCRSTNSAGTSH